MRVTPECDTINSFPICNRADAQFSPSVVYNGENYIVTWADRRYTGTYFWTTAARVTPQGTVLDSGYCIGTTDAHSEFYPRTAFDGSRCLTVWYNAIYEPFGIYGRFVNIDAQPEDTVLTIALTQTYLYNYPKVAFGLDTYFIVWADKQTGSTDYDIYGQRISPEGHLLGNPTTIADGAADQRRPDVTFDGSRFLAVWTQENCIYGQKIATDGQLVGSAFRISDPTADVRDTPRCCAGTENFMVVWSQMQGSYTDIFANADVQTAIEETCTAIPCINATTVFHRGPLSDITGPACHAYDIMGRRVPMNTCSTGVYFVERNGVMEYRVIVVR